MKKLIGAIVGLAVFAPAAAATSSHFVSVSPGKAQQGRTVQVSGSVDHGCEIGHRGDHATIISKGFKGAARHNFAGVPAIWASLAKSRKGLFFAKVQLSSNVAPGKYTVTGRCGGGNFGTTTLTIVSGLPQGY